SAQDAHEAIRPSNIHHTPESIKNRLTSDQFKIYDLIWKRLLASQMTSAIYDTVTCHINTDQDLALRAHGSVIKFQGFLVLYEEKSDLDQDAQADERDKLLPDLEENDPLHLIETQISQAFTRPPARFTEASLVKELEKSGIGRPSTYATIMNKIQSKEYTAKEKNTLKPTELGFIICAMLEQNFNRIMDITFTAQMEDKLDKIAEGDRDWKNYIETFWNNFIPEVEIAEKEAHVPRIPTSKPCPKCGHHLEKIWARKKYFYGCSKYPDCDYTAPLEELELNKDDYIDDFDWDQPCPKCGGKMRVRAGKFGVFFGCEKYPKCNGIVNIPKKGEFHPEQLPACPATGCPGRLVQKRSRFGKPFYACSTYPSCDVIGNEVKEILEKFANHPRTPAPAKKSRAQSGKTVKSAKGRAQPLYKLSAILSEIVNAEEMTRGDITKKLWEYIKKHDLQDKKNRRLIVPDEKLEKLFGSKESLDMMKLARVISNHIE
ncbi:MAG: topoisomerase DNA-binding C4 zinc finger domain-containing protein, partial [Simkaniaceae bacterium]|nr:topoisomerase DNA-binding C4 zinc finger domain-containing protein [Simkaniaceae bacterium]